MANSCCSNLGPTSLILAFFLITGGVLIGIFSLSPKILSGEHSGSTEVRNDQHKMKSFDRPISDSDYPWTYTCVEKTKDGPACQRQMFEGSSNDTAQKVPLKTCILTCGEYGGLWPYPTEHVSLGNELFNFDVESIVLGDISAPSEEIKEMTTAAVDIFKGYLRAKLPNNYMAKSDPGSIKLNIEIKTSKSRISLDTDESYSLKVSASESSAVVRIVAETFFGSRHALESLAQLIEFNKVTKVYQIVSQVEIKDAPYFRYRGLLIDTARNFIPIKDLKRLVDGLSYNKMSILHWHLTDSNAYPFYSRRVPQMAVYGTISEEKIYLPEEVSEFLKYANQRGIKVIPELDAPAHAGNGWQFGEMSGLGKLVLCLNAEPYYNYCVQAPCGQLNPINNNTYEILGDLYKDLLDVFDRDYFHMGGDEISFKCWQSSPEIQDWMEADYNRTDLLSLWGRFQEQALEKLKEAANYTPVSPIVWTSDLTHKGRRFLPPDDYIIQVWSTTKDKNVGEIYNSSYRVILSNKDSVYLDHGLGPWKGTPYGEPSRKSWQVLYNHDLIGQIAKASGRNVATDMYNSGRLLGGEDCMWAERVDSLNMDQKIWPRTAAYAERLWSNPSSDSKLAFPRLIHQREAMSLRGIFPDALLPEACYHIWGFCD